MQDIVADDHKVAQAETERKSREGLKDLGREETSKTVFWINCTLIDYPTADHVPEKGASEEKDGNDQSPGQKNDHFFSRSLHQKVGVTKEDNGDQGGNCPKEFSQPGRKFQNDAFQQHLTDDGARKVGHQGVEGVLVDHPKGVNVLGQTAGRGKQKLIIIFCNTKKKYSHVQREGQKVGNHRPGESGEKHCRGDQKLKTNDET